MKRYMFLGLVVLAFLVLTLAGCDKGGSLDATPEWKDVKNSFAVSQDSRQVTANGIVVYGKAPVPDAYLKDLDTSFKQLVEESAPLSLSARITNPAIHEVWTTPWPCEPAPVSGTLGWRMRADNYDGTIYDYAYTIKYDPPVVETRRDWNGNEYQVTLYSKPDGIGGIYAAERVFNIGTPQSTPAVPRTYLCHNDNMVATKFRYGLEHIFLANSEDDRVLVYAANTVTHLTGGHPLIPMPESGIRVPPESFVKTEEAFVAEDGSTVKVVR